MKKKLTAFIRQGTRSGVLTLGGEGRETRIPHRTFQTYVEGERVCEVSFLVLLLPLDSG